MSVEDDELRDLPGEEWRPVFGFHGIYEISNHGRVKSLARTYDHGLDYKTTAHIATHIMKCSKTKSGKSVMLKTRLGNIANRSTVRVARLVFQTFSRPLRPRESVRHRNGDNMDCRRENLEPYFPRNPYRFR